jgi:hypothetical protein
MKEVGAVKKLSTISTAIVLLLSCVAATFQIGRSVGFKTGSEWALVQADIVAQEAGVFMPVYMKDGKFRVVIRQPRGIYRRAWQMADEHEEARESVREAKLRSAHREAENNI